MSDDAHLTWLDKLMIALCSLALIFGTVLALVALILVIYA